MRVSFDTVIYMSCYTYSIAGLFIACLPHEDVFLISHSYYDKFDKVVITSRDVLIFPAKFGA